MLSLRFLSSILTLRQKSKEKNFLLFRSVRPTCSCLQFGQEVVHLTDDVQQLPVLSQEVHDVEGVSVHHADRQVEHRLARFLTGTNRPSE